MYKTISQPFRKTTQWIEVVVLPGKLLHLPNLRQSLEPILLPARSKMCIPRRKLHLQLEKQREVIFLHSSARSLLKELLLGVRSGPADWTKKELLEKLAKFGGKFSQGIILHSIFYTILIITLCGFLRLIYT